MATNKIYFEDKEIGAINIDDSNKSGTSAYSSSKTNELISAKNQKITIENDSAVITDETTFIGADSGSNPSKMYKRTIGSVWNYIKDNIALLGLTSYGYSGVAEKSKKMVADKKNLETYETICKDGSVTALSYADTSALQEILGTGDSIDGYCNAFTFPGNEGYYQIAFVKNWIENDDAFYIFKRRIKYSENNYIPERWHLLATDSYLEVKYEKLVYLAQNNKLQTGFKYRIIDYVTSISNSPYAASRNHPFDIIVTASSNHTLFSEAKAIQRRGDDYFNESDLSKWELKYQLDNEINEGGTFYGQKGVITYMKDEFENEAFFDFKNIVIINELIYNGEGSNDMSLTGAVINNKLLFKLSDICNTLNNRWAIPFTRIENNTIESIPNFGDNNRNELMGNNYIKKINNCHFNGNVINNYILTMNNCTFENKLLDSIVVYADGLSVTEYIQGRIFGTIYQ